ncbi:RNase P subunit p30-domain-containing protein [Dipodascopsis uninucleata]
MFYDLSIPWPVKLLNGANIRDTKDKSVSELYNTVSMLIGLGYTTIAFDYEISDNKIPSNLLCPIQTSIFSITYPDVNFLTRITIQLSDSSQSQSLPSLASKFDLVVVKPTNEKLFIAACTSLDSIDLITLDLSNRLPFHLRHRTLGAAISRGLKFEIKYSSSIKEINARRNLISNAASLYRATRGKSIIISSNACNSLESRSPYDVINLSTLWGFTTEKGKSAITTDARSVVVHARIRRQSYRQVVEINSTTPTRRVQSQESSDPTEPLTNKTESGKDNKRRKL